MVIIMHLNHDPTVHVPQVIFRIFCYCNDTYLLISTYILDTYALSIYRTQILNKFDYCNYICRPQKTHHPLRTKRREEVQSRKTEVVKNIEKKRKGR